MMMIKVLIFAFVMAISGFAYAEFGSNGWSVTEENDVCVASKEISRKISIGVEYGELQLLADPKNEKTFLKIRGFGIDNLEEGEQYIGALAWTKPIDDELIVFGFVLMYEQGWLVSDDIDYSMLIRFLTANTVFDMVIGDSKTRILEVEDITIENTLSGVEGLIKCLIDTFSVDKKNVL